MQHGIAAKPALTAAAHMCEQRGGRGGVSAKNGIRAARNALFERHNVSKRNRSERALSQALRHGMLRRVIWRISGNASSLAGRAAL